MTGKREAVTLETLLAYLDGLRQRPEPSELTSLLRRLDVGPGELAGWVRFSERSYQRNLVRAGEWYHLWVLCWRNGQRSPIHDHTGSACGVRVLAGTATVSQFARAANGHVKAVGSEDHAAGAVLFSADDDLHQVSNLQAGNADLVTLHVYTPPLLRMGVYSILAPTRSEEVWDLTGGAGI
jgi:cysteine dioxygenase